MPNPFSGDAKNKEAIQHIIEAKAKGIQLASETHGIEPEGYISAIMDSARDTAIILPLVNLILTHLSSTLMHNLIILIIISTGWLVWKTGRSAWLGWFHLERLHRVLEQERWEIEHYRPQEKEELLVLYAAKGFEGKLLDDVVEVLMADNDRLLKVMVEEELGLSLASREHPLKQSLGAALGSFISSLVCLIGWYLWPPLGLYFGAIFVFIVSCVFTARLTQNKIIPAIVWNLGLAISSFAVVYFLLQILNSRL